MEYVGDNSCLRMISVRGYLERLPHGLEREHLDKNQCRFYLIIFYSDINQSAVTICYEPPVIILTHLVGNGLHKLTSNFRGHSHALPRSLQRGLKLRFVSGQTSPQTDHTRNKKSFVRDVFFHFLQVTSRSFKISQIAVPGFDGIITGFCSKVNLFLQGFYWPYGSKIQTDRPGTATVLI